MAGFKLFRCSCENTEHAVISVMNESLYLVHTRNCKQETMYYI